MLRREYPITTLWYTRKKGMSIEEVIDKDPDWMMWAIRSFQNLTPKQAEYFKKRTGVTINPKFIQDVEPYEWMKGDSDKLYAELCENNDLNFTLKKYRGEQLKMFGD